MPESYKEIEERIQEAVNTYRTHGRTSIANLAREYEVPYHRLNRLIQGKYSRSSREATNLKLMKE